MQPPDVHQEHCRQLLEEIAAGHGPSQRSLARQLGIALGLTNLLLKRIVRKGWIRMERLERNRVAYHITPAGVARQAQLSLERLTQQARFYASARDQVLGMLAVVALPHTSGRTQARIVFYGAGELAEIGYVCLHSMGLRLAGVVDPARTHPCLGFPIHRPEELSGTTLAGQPFDRLIVMTLTDRAAIESRLAEAGVPSSAVSWLQDGRPGVCGPVGRRTSATRARRNASGLGAKEATAR